MNSPRENDSVKHWLSLARETEFDLATLNGSHWESHVMSELRASDSWKNAPEEGYTHAEQRCIDLFLSRILGQSSDLVGAHKALVKSSSIAFSTIAAGLRRSRCANVGYVSPADSEVPTALAGEGLCANPLTTQLMTDIDYCLDAATRLDALVLGIPADPTGWMCSEEHFQALIKMCAQLGVAIALDLSQIVPSGYEFRVAYSNLALYPTLEWYTIEDPGETWGLIDSNVRIVLSRSKPPLPESVQPYPSLALVRHLSCYLASPEIRSTHLAEVRKTIKINRECLRAFFHGRLPIYEVNYVSRTTVAWLQVDSNEDTLTLSKGLLENGVAVIPGTVMSTADPRGGKNYMRVSLLREPQLFVAALHQFDMYMSWMLDG